MGDRWADWQTSLSSTTNATGTALSFHNAKQAAWEVTWPDNMTAGVVVITTSTDKSYAGAWREIYRFTWASPDDKKEGEEFDGPLAFMRAELSGVTGTHTDPIVAKCQALDLM